MNKTKYLLPAVPQYFKANLHTHTTISDGKLSPEETKKAYKDKGYQILCLTDHHVVVDHSAMNDPDFLMLTGVEVNYNEQSDKPWYNLPVYHLNLIAKRPDNLWYPGVPSTYFPNVAPYLDKMDFDGVVYDYSPESVNAMIKRANEMGFLVMYNHPTWSNQSYPDYAPLKGLWGMELRNSECCVMGNDENNARVFKDLLNLGNQVYPLGTDDMHKLESLGCSWIMVGAAELTYGSVIDALEKGDFYMSCGPEILSLTTDGNTLKVTCSDARQVTLETQGRFACRTAAVGEDWIHTAEFDLTEFLEVFSDDPTAYILLTVTAPDGSYATTRAYYLKEL